MTCHGVRDGSGVLMGNFALTKKLCKGLAVKVKFIDNKLLGEDDKLIKTYRFVVFEEKGHEVPASGWVGEGILPSNATVINDNTLHEDAGMGYSKFVKDNGGLFVIDG
ncbi:hypothetical protein Tco_0051910 [Tanacetum coccineum]